MVALGTAIALLILTLRLAPAAVGRRVMENVIYVFPNGVVFESIVTLLGDLTITGNVRSTGFVSGSCTPDSVGDCGVELRKNAVTQTALPDVNHAHFFCNTSNQCGIRFYGEQAAGYLLVRATNAPAAGQVCVGNADGTCTFTSGAITTTSTTSTSTSSSTSTSNSTPTTTSSSTSSTTSTTIQAAAADWGAVAPFIQAVKANETTDAVRANRAPCDGTVAHCDVAINLSPNTCSSGGAPYCSSTSVKVEGAAATALVGASAGQYQFVGCLYSGGCSVIRDQVSAVSICSWVYPTDDSHTETIFSTSTDSVAVGGIALQRSAAGTPTHALNCTTSGGGTSRVLQSSIAAPANQWSYVCCRYHASPTPTISFTVNGNDAGSATKVCSPSSSVNPRKSCTSAADCGSGTCDDVNVMGAPSGPAAYWGTSSTTSTANVWDGGLDDYGVTSVDEQTVSTCRQARCNTDGAACICSGTAYKSCTVDGDCGGAGICDNAGTSPSNKCKGRLVGVCAGGSNSGKACFGDSTCPSSTCTACTMPATCNDAAAQ